MTLRILTLASSLLISAPALSLTEAELVEQARKEGKLNLATNTLGYGDLLSKAFEKKYPFLKINRTRFAMAEERYFNYHLMEMNDESRRADVVLRCQDRDLLNWLELDWAADLSELPNWENRPKVLEDDNRYVYFMGSPHVVFYNPAKIKEADLPRTYDELLEPKWKKKVALKSPYAGSSGAFLAQYVRANRDHDWFLRLGANKPYVGSSGKLVDKQVLSGAYPVGLARDVEVKTFGRSKLKYKLLEGKIPYQYQLAVVNKKAPNSAAARLFANFVLSPEAVALLESEGYSVGKVRAEQAANREFWEWDMTKIKNLAQHESAVALAQRQLKKGGAKMDMVRVQGMKMSKKAD